MKPFNYSIFPPSSLAIKVGAIFLWAFWITVPLLAQKKKVQLKDSLDKAFDLSDFIIDANGFVPVPIIITEPALGGFGAGLVPVFLQKKPPYIDSVKGEMRITPVAPDISGVAAVYTVNNTWLMAAFRRGTLVKSRIKYTGGAGYASVNMSFYKTIQQLGEKKFEFNIKALPLMLQGTKRIGKSHWYAGLKYLFLKTDVNYKGDSLLPPSFVKPGEYSSIVSQLGAIVELDNLDNIFTPNKGFKVHGEAILSDNFLGSDYEYWRINFFTYAYTKLAKNLVGALRVDGQQALGQAPFFMLPYVELRGVPVMRYQGEATTVTEAEFRWDFLRRWSVMFYSGMGKAFDEWSDFGDARLVVTYGSGIRYFIARKFGLRMGLDIAKGPEEWAYYIVFGSSWLK